MVVDREAPVVGGLSARREGSEEALGTLLSNGTATKRAAKGEQDGTDGQGSLQVKQQRHLFSAGLLLIAFPLLLFFFVPLSKIFHTAGSTPSPVEVGDIEQAGIEQKPSWTIDKGSDPWRNQHPEEHGAAWKAEHGEWASQGPALGHNSEYLPVGETKSNGTHDFERTVIIISLDGVRADYLTRNMTPHLLSLSERGMRAEYMLSVFPSLTFPNHWSIMTGLYPESHGIVANDFYDPTTGKEFTYTVPERSWPAEWWHGEPMWSTVQKAGMKSAVLFWPGPPKMADGTQPGDWRAFRNNVEWPVKTDIITKWLDQPISKRPNFIAAYLPEVDQEGHRSGPESDDLQKYLLYVDAFAKSIHEALEERHLTDIVDVLFVSDHGMTSTSNERLVYLDRILGEDGWQAIEHKEGWPSCGLRFKEGTDTEEMLSRLRKGASESNGGFQVFTHDTMPKQWHFSGNPRIAPIYLVPEVGWVISDQEEHLDTMKGDYHPYGNHGYDFEHPDMHAIFIAHGPFGTALRKAKSEDAQVQTITIDAFQNIEIYNLVMRLLKIPGRYWAPTNGTGSIWESAVDWSGI